MYPWNTQQGHFLRRASRAHFPRQSCFGYPDIRISSEWEFTGYPSSESGLHRMGHNARNIPKKTRRRTRRGKRLGPIHRDFWIILVSQQEILGFRQSGYPVNSPGASGYPVKVPSGVSIHTSPWGSGLPGNWREKGAGGLWSFGQPKVREL